MMADMHANKAGINIYMYITNFYKPKNNQRALPSLCYVMKTLKIKYYINFYTYSPSLNSIANSISLTYQPHINF